MAKENAPNADGSLNEDGVVMGPDSVEQDEVFVKKKKGSKNKMVFILGSVAVIGFVLYGMLGGGGTTVGTMPVATPPSMNTTAGGINVRDNPAYLEELRRSNDANAEQARAEGRTYIPASENVLIRDDLGSETIPEAVAPAVAPVPERAPVEIARISPPPTMPQLRRETPAPTSADGGDAYRQGPAGGQGQQGQQQENPYLNAMGQYFARVAQTRTPRESSEGTVQPGTRSASSSPQGSGQPNQQNFSANGVFEAQQPRASEAGEVPAAYREPPQVAPQNASGRITLGSDGYARDDSGNVIGYRDQSGVVRTQAGTPIGTVGQQSEFVPLPGSQFDVAGTQESSTQPAQQAPQAERENVVYVPAGDVLYAEVLTNASSDRPEVPVIATVTVGKYEGARLLGTFSVDDQSGKLVISFSQMTFGDNTVPVQALAVDGFSGDNAVRSGIERRYVRRYAPIFASAFINGLADGLAETNQTVIGVGDNQTVVTTAKTVEESAWAGVARASGAISDDISSRAPKGPNIKLGAGYPVGILFVDDLRDNPEGDR